MPLVSGPLGGVDPSCGPIVVLGRPGRRGRDRRIARGGARASRSTRRLGDGLLGAADRTVGAGFGVVQALLIVWLAGEAPRRGPGPAPRRGGRRLDRGPDLGRHPAATDRDRRRPRRLAGRHRAARRLHRLRTAARAAGRPARPIPRRGPSPPPRRPARSRSRRRPAACRRSGPGSSSPTDYVVTNAHVVAGADSDGVRVNAPVAGVLDAVPVLFDPELDVALLHVERPRRPCRSHSPGRTRAGRDRRGARLPGRRRADDRAGGGHRPLSRRPASTSTAARQVRREILELRAADRPRRQRRSVDPDRWDGRWRRLRRGQDERRRRLRALAAGRGRARHAGPRPDRGGRHGRLRAHLSRVSPASSGPCRVSGTARDPSDPGDPRCPTRRPHPIPPSATRPP